MDIDYKLGPILSSDTFYTDEDEMSMCLKLGLLGVEMESLALYLNANKCGKKALTICTVSNIIPKGIDLPSEDRQNGFKDMARVALELIQKIKTIFEIRSLVSGLETGIKIDHIEAK